MNLFSFGPWANCLAIDIGTSQFRIGVSKTNEVLIKDLPQVGPWVKHEGSDNTQFFCGGDIVDDKVALSFITRTIKELKGQLFIKPQCIVSVSPMSYKPHRSALYDLFKAAGCRDVHFMHSDVLAADGAGLLFGDKQPFMIGILGAERCDFSILEDCKSISSSGSMSGWNNIVRTCATKVRMLSSDWPNYQGLSDALWGCRGEDASYAMESYGLSKEDIHTIIDVEVLRIVSSVRASLDKGPKGYSNEIQYKKIALTGGLAENSYFVSRMSILSGLNFLPIKNARDCVFNGLMNAAKKIPNMKYSYVGLP